MNFYLASGYSNRYNLRELAQDLIRKGHTIQSSWIYIEDRPDRTDSSIWDSFAADIARFNLQDLEKSDAMIVDANGIRPDGNGGAHFEMGFGIASSMTMFYVGERRNTFAWLPEICVVENYEQLLDIIPDEE